MNLIVKDNLSPPKKSKEFKSPPRLLVIRRCTYCHKQFKGKVASFGAFVYIWSYIQNNVYIKVKLNFSYT